MADLNAIQRLQAGGDMKGLMALRAAARSPVQRLGVNSALAEVCEAAGRWEAATEAWRECVACSEGDAIAWERMGDAAMKAGRVPLAVGALQGAYQISGELRVLLKVALARLRVHDYSNALTLVTFISDSTHSLPEADSTRALILSILQGKSLYEGSLLRARAEEDSVEAERVVYRVGNLLSLAKAVRKLVESSKDAAVAIYVFTRAQTKDAADPKPVVKLPEKPVLRLRALCEDVKKEVFSHCAAVPLLPLGTDKLPESQSWKVKCCAEPALDQFLDVEWRLQPLVQRLLTELCGNRPRPSPALSGELAWEVLQIYLAGKTPVTLQTEVLTLFELALLTPKYEETCQKMYEEAADGEGMYATQEMQLRFKYAQAWFYYHSGERTSTAASQVDALITAYALLNDLENSIGQRCYYLWWTGRMLSHREVCELKGNIEDEVKLCKLGEAAKGGGGVQEMMGVMRQLCVLLTKRCSKDDPAFYWQKLKILLRPLLKSPLPDPDHLLLTQNLAQYLAVLQCNYDDNHKVAREIDLRYLFKVISVNILRKPKGIRNGFEGYLVVAAANVVKVRKELFGELSAIVRRFGGESTTLAKFFLRFHSLCSDFANGDKDLHYSLCRAYEKPVFHSNDLKAMSIIYSQLYGFSVLPKDCPCGIGKVPPPDHSYPHSLGKLKRMVLFASKVSSVSVDLGVYYPQTYDKAVSPALDRCLSKIPDLFLSCPSVKQAKSIVSGLLSGGDFQHNQCCGESARSISELFYARYATDSFEIALKKEYNSEVFLSLLETAETQAEKLIVLNPRRAVSWMLLGQVYFHKWMAGYFDYAIIDCPKPEFEGFAEKSMKCFQVLDCLQPASQSYVLLVRGLIQFLRYRLTAEGLFEAEKNITAAVRISKDPSLESLIIAGLVELHIKSEQCQSLFEKVNASTDDKYDFLRLIARYKTDKSEENWAKIENYPRPTGYLTYVSSKRLKEKHQDDLLAFISQGKLYETKVLDRVCVFERKKARMAMRFVEFFEEMRDLGRLLALCKEVGGRKNGLFGRVWERGVTALCRMAGELKDVSEMKLYYELIDHISLTDSPLKLSLLSSLSSYLPRFHGLFGIEACEALKSTKRRRKK